jgi:hypothetical protein
MKGCFGGRRPRGNTRDRWENTVWGMSQMCSDRNWKAPAKKREGWRKVREAMAQKRANATGE